MSTFSTSECVCIVGANIIAAIFLVSGDLFPAFLLIAITDIAIIGRLFGYL